MQQVQNGFPSSLKLSENWHPVANMEKQIFESMNKLIPAKMKSSATKLGHSYQHTQKFRNLNYTKQITNGRGVSIGPRQGRNYPPVWISAQKCPKKRRKNLRVACKGRIRRIFEETKCITFEKFEEWMKFYCAKKQRNWEMQWKLKLLPFSSKAWKNGAVLSRVPLWDKNGLCNWNYDNINKAPKLSSVLYCFYSFATGATA